MSDDNDAGWADEIEDMLEGNFHTPESVQMGDLFNWKVRSLRDAYKPRDPLQFLVDGLLPYPSLSIVFGGPGSLKSMLLADMAACVASGRKWLEALPNDGVKPGVTFTTTQAPVLWIDFDNGIRRTDERIEAMARSRDLPESAPLYYVSMPRPWLDVSRIEMIDNLAKLIKSLGVRMVVIDNLGLVTGDTEENSGDMAQVMGNLRWLCEETEAAVLIIHHQRKSGGQANDKGIRRGETLRGHSSIEAALDLALLIERNGETDSVAVIPTKVRGYKEHTIFGAYFAYEHREGTKDLCSARFYSKEVVSAEEAALIAIEASIKKVLRVDGPSNQGHILDEVRDMMAAQPDGHAPAVNRVRGILKQMATDRKILEEGNGGGRSYRLI